MQQNTQKWLAMYLSFLNFSYNNINPSLSCKSKMMQSVIIFDHSAKILIGMQHASQNCLVKLGQVLSQENKMHRYVKNST